VVSFGWSVLVIAVGMPVIFVGTFLIVGKIIKRLKERITYPRTGYVRYPKREPASRVRRMLVGGGIGFVTALLINLALATFGLAAQWTVIAIIIMMSMLYIAYINGVYRYYIMGILTFIWGIGMIYMPVAEDALFTWFFGGVGLVFILSGLIVFITYLLRYPKAEGEADDR
jgi:MFS family permease